MIFRWLHRDSSHNSAEIARKRLLSDSTIRRNRLHTPPVAAMPFPAVSTVGANTAPSPANDEAQLSPRAQKWHIIATARHFREYYLAKLSYHEQRNMTIAVLQPYLVQALAGEAPFEIRVDGQGRTTIVRLEEEKQSKPSYRFPRFLVALLIVAALTSGALALFL